VVEPLSSLMERPGPLRTCGSTSSMAYGCRSGATMGNGLWRPSIRGYPKHTSLTLTYRPFWKDSSATGLSSAHRVFDKRGDSEARLE